MGSKLWHSPENAAAYHDFAGSSPMYRELCRELIDLAAVPNPSAILDLGCGTGVSTQVLAEHYGNSAKIVGVDFSLPQLEQAKKLCLPRNVRLINCKAEEFDLFTNETFDLVICSASFWNFDPDLVLAALERRSSDVCRLAFNMLEHLVPRCHAELLKKHSIPPDRIHEEANFADTARAYANEMFGYAPAESSFTKNTSYEDRFEHAFGKSRFTLLEASSRVQLTAPGIDLDWWRIPVFLDMILPGLTYEKALAALEHAERKLKAAQTSEAVVPRRTLGAIKFLAERMTPD